jgi:PqqD family protein of HPr-rel-A system
MSNWQNYKPKDGLSLQEVEGELVILDQANQKIHQLNPAATVVWRAIAETSSVDSAAALAALLEQFDVEEQAAAADVEQALQQFAELKLIADDSV